MEQWEHLLNELRAEFTLREQELDLLHAIDLKLLTPGQSSEEIFHFVIARLSKLLDASSVTILLRRSTYLEPMYSSLKTVIGQRVPISDSLTGMCLTNDSIVNVPDIEKSLNRSKYAPLRGYRGAPMRSLLAAPIRIRGLTVGALEVESRTPAAFKAVHERIAVTISAQIAMVLQSAQMFEGTVLLADVDRMMFDDNDSQQVIGAALNTVMAALRRLEHVQHTGAQIMFLRGQDELEIVHSTNPVEVGLMLDVADSVSGRAIRERRTINVGDVSADPDYKRLLGDSIRSEIAVPILFGEDDIALGVLNVESEESEAFYGFYQVILESFAEKVRTLLAFAKLRADVTEALELRSADDLLAAVGDQTSHIIHRLNNTVGAMRLRIIELQEMQKDGRLHDGDFLDESLRALRSLAERTLRMPDEVTQILGQGGSSVDVNQCVRDAIKTLDIPPNVRLQTSLDERIPRLPLYCFDVVVQNLLQNATDAMADGGRLEVSTRAMLNPTLPTGYFELVVRDTGQGMPPDVQKRIFELNFTTKREKGKGLGLGMWWVRNFVRRARGDITIHTTSGSGTEVIVKIPVDQQVGAVIADRGSGNGNGREEAQP